MIPLTEPLIRKSLINATKGEAGQLSLPRRFESLEWDRLEFLGWRDPKAPLRGYLVRWVGDAVEGIMLKAAESVMSRRIAAMCLLCGSVQSADNVSLFTARRRGAAGRNGNTVGTYICADLRCSDNLRGLNIFGRVAEISSDLVQQRVAALTGRLDGFSADVRRTD